ncbi:hypothetical protein BC829DRAFT_232229 [Chytridium lagenaria]|nr:hypothetical protein BC829DRAFT_232229 [Chytridium lagenaria]
MHASSKFTLRETEMDFQTVSHLIANRRKLSVLPIRHLCVVEFDNVVATIVSFTGTDLNVAAYTADLEDVWQCKIDYLKLTGKDRQNRTVPQGKPEVVDPSFLKVVPGILDVGITAMCADRYRRQLLVALKGGVVVCLEYGQHRLSGKFDSNRRMTIVIMQEGGPRRLLVQAPVLQSKWKR